MCVSSVDGTGGHGWEGTAVTVPVTIHGPYTKGDNKFKAISRLSKATEKKNQSSISADVSRKIIAFPNNEHGNFILFFFKSSVLKFSFAHLSKELHSKHTCH